MIFYKRLHFLNVFGWKKKIYLYNASFSIQCPHNDSLSLSVLLQMCCHCLTSPAASPSPAPVSEGFKHPAVSVQWLAGPTPFLSGPYALLPETRSTIPSCFLSKQEWHLELPWIKQKDAEVGKMGKEKEKNNQVQNKQGMHAKREKKDLPILLTLHFKDG